MLKKNLVCAYFIFSVIAFGIGLNVLYSDDPVVPGTPLPVPKTETCQAVFGETCSQPGQCSWNVTHGTSTCKIHCKTKVIINGKEKIIDTVADCGDLVVQEVPEEPDTSGTTTGR